MPVFTRAPRGFFAELASSETAKDIYGFIFNLKCDCGAFVKGAAALPYFKQDVIAAQNGFVANGWPVLLAAMPGARSQVHTDSELELIQPHMAQKPVLRGEVG